MVVKFIRSVQSFVENIIENKEGSQYLRVMSVNEEEINKNILSYLKEWSNYMNTPVIYKEGNSWRSL